MQNSPSDDTVLSGVSTCPTASQTINNNQVASTSYVRTAINNVVGSAPTTLDVATLLCCSDIFRATENNIKRYRNSWS
jgi:hypothetical protein